MAVRKCGDEPGRIGVAAASRINNRHVEGRQPVSFAASAGYQRAVAAERHGDGPDPTVEKESRGLERIPATREFGSLLQAGQK